MQLENNSTRPICQMKRSNSSAKMRNGKTSVMKNNSSQGLLPTPNKKINKNKKRQSVDMRSKANNVVIEDRVLDFGSI